MRKHVAKNSITTMLFIVMGILASPCGTWAETEEEKKAFERGRAFERGYEAGRHESDRRPSLIDSGSGVSVGASRYSFRDWDEDWGFSISITPWGQREIGSDSTKSRIDYQEFRLGWAPIHGSFQEAVDVFVFPNRITKEIGLSVDGDAYFIEKLAGTSYPLTQRIRIPFRFGVGATVFALQETDPIIIDGVDYTESFDQETDWLLDFHLLVGAGIEAHSSDPGFAMGAMVGYRWTAWELWKITTTFTDPRTGRANTERTRGSEFGDGSATGMTVDAYVRYLF